MFTRDVLQTFSVKVSEVKVSTCKRHDRQIVALI